MLFLLVIFSPFLCISQVDLNLGLKAYYPFNGNANDVSGNNNNPVFNNATLTTDRFGNPNSAYHFDGSNTYMKVLNDPSINFGNTMSVALKIKPTGYYTGPCYNNMLLMKGDADYLPGNYNLRFADNITGCTSSPTTATEHFYSTEVITTTPLVQLNQWYDVVWTSDGTTSKIYINCELKGSVPQTETSFTNLYDLYIGKLNDATYPFWLNGDLDDVRIYDRAINFDEVKAISGCGAIVNCNNWLNTPSANSFARIGDLDVPGNSITVEATINRTLPYLPGAGDDTEGDVVSKHTGPADINYLLRPNHAYITTTNGFFGTPDICDLELNKTYHIAMVYDGAKLKFYRDGFLMSQVNATGNLFQNNLNTQIGHYDALSWNTQFLGDINEVRIWNIARTQSQIQAFMNTSLPNPTTQPGLLAYYTFEDLLNKQGNALWNATLFNGASINNTNSNCDFTADSCSVVPVTQCNDWLETSGILTSATVGDLDIPGNQLTVEATFNRTLPADAFGSYGFLVSKHTGPSNVNYALWPAGCSVTTTNGQVFASETCPFEINKTYHVAMVYDGTSLKYYRNGFLMGQVPATGNLIQNDLLTTIGHNSFPGAAQDYQFAGVINEVRIWNVARTQAQLQTYMNSSLPGPTTQAGLKGYYVYNDLTNKQGNATFNATLTGSASINSSNPDCSFNADSCNVITTITSFTAPDTVCVNDPVQLINTSVGTSNYYWTFCETNLSSTPTALNLGNPAGDLSSPVFTDIVKDETGNYYGFTVNAIPSGLVRLNYGNSILNTPTVDFLGNIGGALPADGEGIQVVKSNNNWIAIIVGGNPAIGNVSQMATVNFGPSLNNPAPVGTNWGNIGNLNFPIDLFVFNENNNWYGYTVNSSSNTITQFNFGSDFSVTPTGINLGNIGSLDQPVGIGEIKDGVNWHLFITNKGASNSLARLDFGNSLLNIPTAVNIGNPGNALNQPRDISFIRLCDGIIGLSVNFGTNTITKLDFQNNILGVPITSSLGNLGNLNFPHSLSKLFRVNSDIYCFITNVNNNSLTRLVFNGCTGIPGSSLQNPNPITYSQPGTYNVNLLTDISLPTQNSFCKKIVVKDCAVQSISNIINDYTPVLALNPCNNSITVEDGTAFNAGDTVVIMQMKGADIDVSNTATFGTLLNYHNAGNYEFNYVKARTGNIVELKNKLTRPYDIPNGKVQLIRVPYYSASVNVSSTLTCLPWDGSKGGVLVLNARDTVNLNADIDVTGKGFLGGAGFNSANPVLNCFDNDYIYPSTAQIIAGLKGESIVTLTPDIVRGKGADASGGGGGLGHNSGGGGGANAGAGGFGGYQLDNCGGFPFDNRGIGGYALTYNTAANRVFMGGGGGAGNADNPNNYNPTGGNGGGIVIVNSGYLKSNGNIVKADGDDGLACTVPPYLDCHDGMPGGGGGGAVLLNVTQYIDNTVAQKKGGHGTDMIWSIAPGRIGPGGGGGGGMLFIKNASLPANVSSINTGGLNGVIIQDGNNPYGTTPGADGLNLFNLVVPVDTVLFKPNIDSVRIKDSGTVCRSFDFHGFGYTNTTGIVSWHWIFGDSFTADVQNTSHTYSANGTYNVTLVATDINGCKDSIIRQVTVVNCSNNISSIINDYTPVLAFNPCDNSLNVQDASQFNAGDTVLLIQMKGAQIDSTNTTSFGTVTNYKNAGNYEFNFVLSKTGNIIKLKNKLTRQYDIPVGRVQLIRVPYYTSTVVTSTLTCLPWDGTKGGVLAFNVRDTLTLNADIDVNAKGFRGGGTGNGFQCGLPEYAFAFSTGFKGEGISEIAGTWSAGGGHVANGGGGCFAGNSGAGGGSNIVTGGMGGQEYTGCGTLQGIAGQALINNLNTKIYLGGGGGGGQEDNGFPVFDGGNGGGIIFISSNYVKGNSYNINANGQSRPDTIHDEGGAAGGGGGSVILIANNIINTVNVNFTGGAGNSNFNTSFPNDCHGPGSGGSGGVLFFKQPVALANTTINGNGGIAGLILNPVSACYNTTHGATNGSNGAPRFGFVLNRDTVLFKPNIDSVRIQDNTTSCTGFDFHGFGYTNTDPIATWDWDLGDGNHANTQNTSHGYSGAGPYTVHLVATDINGCKDSITTTVTPTQVVVNAGLDTSFCSNGTVTHILHGITTGTGYTWTPAGLLDNNTLQNPTATISTTTMFYLNTSSSLGCNAIDSVLLTVNPVPAVTTINDFSICKLDSMLLTTTGTATTYQWTPPLSVNDPSISNPYFHDTVSQQMIVTGTITATGCFKKDTVNVTIKPLPLVISIPDTSLCGVHNVTLTTTGAQTYSWLPATGLSNAGSANPIFTGSSSQTYIVTGTGANTCKANDTVTITVHPQPAVSTINDISICRGDSIQLTTNSTAENNQWAPALSVSNPTILNPYFHDTVSQQMIITGTNATGCFAKDTVNITVKPLPLVQTIPDSALCGAHNITLTTTGAQAYSWVPATDLSNAGIASPVFTGTTTQTYTVTGTGANACKASDTVTITINSVPVVSTITNNNICKGDSIQLISNSNATSSHWSPATSVSNPNTINPYFVDTVSQTMIITGTNNSTGCFSTASVNITVKPTPNVQSIPDFTSCSVNTVTLTTTGAQTYSWTPATNLNDPTIANPVFTGTTGVYIYYVTGTAPNGCIAKDTVTVTIAAKPVFNAPENKTICANESVQLDGNNGTTYEYLWTPATHLSNATIVDPMADPVTTTTYTLIVRDETCNYDSTFSVRVTVNPLPIVSASKSNDLDCGTPESQLTAFGASQYTWIPAEGLNDYTIYNPIASPYVTTQYIVVGTDMNGCKNKDTVIVRRKGGKYFGFNVPNSFTPNRDGLNDCWGVTYWGETKNFHLMIFNRWGEKVFETHTVSECWDGNYKGNPSSIGNYVYYLSGETLCGNVTRKGNLLLIR
ncbi:MAG: LamG-like jellyroll fold domain-containing protein [Ferruginibacter sp.]